MKIITLLENNTLGKDLKPKHGIALYIETEKTKILFDAGPDKTFVENAKKLGVDLSQVDLMILSHGHSDHGGGIAAFLEVNDKAWVMMKESATSRFYAKPNWFLRIKIGLDLNKLKKDRLQFISGDHRIGENLHIITDFEKTGFSPRGNKSLYSKEEGGKLELDSFEHEICLLVQEAGKNILFTGCSHSGLGNMVNTVKKRTGIDKIDAVIGGFHLYNPVNKKTESEERMDTLLSEGLDNNETIYYTGHCTGDVAFSYLKSKLGDKVLPFNTGTAIEF